MKCIKSILISLSISLLFVNLATANNEVPVIRVKDKQLYVSLENVAAPTTVKVLDRAGVSLFEQKVTTSGQFESVFNLDWLPLGTYTLIIQSSEKETVQPITITGTALLLDDSKRTEYFPATFSQERENVRLSMLNPTNDAVRVFVIDRTGVVRYQDAITDHTVIEKNYNLKQLPAGKYTVIVNSAKKIFTKQVSLR